MNKQEFTKLFEATDDISTIKVSKILQEYCNSTDNEETLQCMDTIDVLSNVNTFMEQMDEITHKFDKPYTIQDSIDALRMRIVRNYVDSLEE